jgi:hypothetical protein
MSILSKPGPGPHIAPGERDGAGGHATSTASPAGFGGPSPAGDAGRGGCHVEQHVFIPINRIVARLQWISNEMREVEQRFRETMQRVAFDRVALDRPFAEHRAMRDAGRGADASWPHDAAGRYGAERFDRSLAAVTDRVTVTSWHMCEVTRELVMLHERVAAALRGGKPTE